MLNITLSEFDRAQYCIPWYRWNMIIKFSEQIANSFAKIINGYKDEFKILPNIWDRAFVARFRGGLRILLNIYDQAFCKNSQKLEAAHNFCKIYIWDVWQVSEYASELASKVKNVSFLNQFEYQRSQITFY